MRKREKSEKKQMMKVCCALLFNFLSFPHLYLDLCLLFPLFLGTPSSLRLLGKSKCWLMDGTFEIFPSIRRQLFYSWADWYRNSNRAPKTKNHIINCSMSF